MAEGDPLDRLLIGLDGRFDLVQGETLLETFGAGHHAGATGLLAPRPARATLTARTPARLLSLDAATFQDLAHRRPRLCATLMHRLALRLSQDNDQLRRAAGGGGSPGDLL